MWMDFLSFLNDHAVLYNAGQVTAKLNRALTTIQTVLTTVIVGVGICVALFNVVTKLPNLSDPHEKNQFWKTQGYILGGVAFGAIVIWLVPWVYRLFT